MSEQRLTRPDTIVVARDGWYRVTASDTAVLTLSDPEKPAFLEITAEPSSATHARVGAGRYQIRSLSSRNEAQWHIQRLGTSGFARFLAAEFGRRLLRGDGLAALIRQGRNLLFGRRGSGAVARAPRAVAGTVEPGPLARARLRDFGCSDMPAPSDGPMIYIDAQGADAAGLDRQSYRGFTVDLARRDGCDFCLSLPPGAELSPSALSKLVAPAIADPKVEVVYADTFVDGVPTWLFGFDPLLHLHAADLSDLVIVRRERALTGGTLDGLDARRIVRINEPLMRVSRPAPPVIRTGRRPADYAAGTGSISCIIPTRDRADLLAQVTLGLLDESDGVGEIIIIDNGSTEAETLALFERLKARGVVVLRDDGDFNFSRLCNAGAVAASHPVLAFINNDIKIRRRDGLTAMARRALVPDVGAVGTRLLYADGSLQHGGVALGLFGVCGHLFRGWPEAAWAQVPSLVCPSTRSAVTAALLVVEASKFRVAGGFDAETFPVTLNDVDLCLRLARQGYRCIYEPAGEAFHLEGQSRGSDEVAPEKRERRNAEIRAFIARWQDAIAAEAWFSPNLSRVHEQLKLL